MFLQCPECKAVYSHKIKVCPACDKPTEPYPNGYRAVDFEEEN